MTGHVAITMAGFGSRFQAAGYTQPKYRIEVLGRPLFAWSMMALLAFRDAGWRFSFAIRAADQSEDFIRRCCRDLDIAVEHIASLDAPTDGQATTARMISQRIEDAESPFLVYNIDTYVRPYALRPDDIGSGLDGWVPCFPGPGASWSFARLDGDGHVVELREKERISDHATIGLYWFSSAALYRSTYDDYFADGGGEEKGERYIAPMYNHLIAQGRAVGIAGLAFDDVGMLGTPQQVADFTTRPPPSLASWQPKSGLA